MIGIIILIDILFMYAALKTGSNEDDRMGM